jgi:tRNA-dihydrouridine synthase
VAVRLARAAAQGSGRPVTVKLRSGLEPGDRSGLELAVRLADEAEIAAIAFHPRPAAVQHKGDPDYALTRELVDRVAIPVIISGGLHDASAARAAYSESGADAVMIARGALGNPWVFGELSGRRAKAPSVAEIVEELLWIMGRSEEHFGERRATQYLRKLYPWYLDQLGMRRVASEPLQRATTLVEARQIVSSLAPELALAA